MTPEQLFPEQREAIQHLRDSDPIFHEICSDYELIAGVARKEPSGDEAIVECLAGLAQEIERALARSRGGLDANEPKTRKNQTGEQL